jgi:hypothetical protein
LARKFESLGFAIDHKSPGFYGLWFGQIFLPLNKKEYEKDFQFNDVCISMFAFAQQAKLPFVGHRSFDIMEGYSGTGTPHYYLDVKKTEMSFWIYTGESGQSKRD